MASRGKGGGKNSTKTILITFCRFQRFVFDVNFSLRNKFVIYLEEVRGNFTKNYMVSLSMSARSLKSCVTLIPSSNKNCGTYRCEDGKKIWPKPHEYHFVEGLKVAEPVFDVYFTPKSKLWYLGEKKRT